jgi:oxaloacetate decarboxylase gamma subunit
MSELMTEALELMVVGMGFVFVFLAVLVFLTSIMSKLINKYLPAPAPVAAKAPKVKNQTASQDAQLLAVLSAAVAEYRSDQKK